VPQAHVYHARINFAATGVGVQALISIRLGVHIQSVAESFFDFAGSLPEVVQVFQVTGDEDYHIHVVARSSDHLREIVLTSFAGRPEVVHIETSLVFGYSASDLAEPHKSMQTEAIR
jgi:DNA-binding Lrp family transcriptional regulator